VIAQLRCLLGSLPSFGSLSGSWPPPQFAPANVSMCIPVELDDPTDVLT
jgi:hypothetical protein